MKMTVLGMKKFKGDVEGVNYDSTTVFVRMKQDESKGTAKGYAGQDLKFGDSSNYDKLSHLSFPLEADIELETITTGKGGMKTIITDFKIIAAAKPAA